MDHGFPSPPAGGAPGLLGRSLGGRGFGPGSGATLGSFGRRRRATPWDGQDPIREELFSAGRLEEHARSLAAAQPIVPRPSRRPAWTLPRRLAGADALASRLAENGAVLLGCYQSIMKVVEDGRTITPAAEWLIDNYHLVERQVRAIRLDLPPGYYRQLPKLASGPFAGTPRVLGLAWAYVAHTDSRFDGDGLVRTVRAYQEVQPLSIGELWAVSITLRAVLIENLRRLAQLTVRNCVARQDADAVADRLLGRSGHPAEPLAEVAAGHGDTRLPEAFAVQLVHRLRDQDGTTFPALAWLDQHLAAQGTTAEAAVRDVHRRRGTANVTVRNIITSLRLIQDVDWNDLFERMSLVDDVLAAGSGPAAPGVGFDAAGFAAMDFPTRNLYRGAIEELSRGSGQTELEVAHAAVQAARAAQPPDESRLADPGFFLLAGGRRGFEASVGYRMPWPRVPARLNRAFGLGGYMGAILVAALVLLALALSAVAACGLGGFRLALLGVLGAIPAIDAATALVNRGVAAACHPKLLPGMELRHGVPLPLRTLVAVPMLLTTAAEIAEAVEHLEIHYLASPDGELYFALLSDWTDAAGEHADGDAGLLAAAEAGIAGLNRRYGPAPGGDRFLLLHRRRTWSAGEARWMGWERKRGKLHELNRLLRGAADTNFLGAAGVPPPVPAAVRYVITLDADTRLLRDTVGRLIGKMAHPLNRPRFDAVAGRVIEGYGVLQPRVTPSLPVGREGSPYQRIFSSLSGIDPYASAVSDVYQDLFGEGSYAGKGIYDVDAFELALAGRVPEGALLSHDLFEGTFARAGFASDVEVVEDFPARYDVGALRHHRWARGDWQLLPWLLGRRGAGAPGIGRWKMLDNLRRTLSAPLAVAALIAGWAMPFNAALAWTAMVLLTVLLPMVLPVLAAIPPRRPGITPASHLRALGCDLRLGAVLSLLAVTFLAHQAWLMGDAIARTLDRLYRSHRHMLEWMTAAQATNGRRPSLVGYLRRMAGALVLAVGALGVAWLSGMEAHGLAGRGTVVLAMPFALLWLASPVVARWVSLSPQVAGRRPMPAADARALRLTARRTWRYFETFVTADDAMLPPDNFQEDPAPVLAHRTSPTNLGLYLLSVASARDFGWIGTADAAGRLEATLATMGRMERFRGHFLNWYDTRDLRPLDPRYVSSVDSGNLAGHLIALANTCREWQGSPVNAGARLAGIGDAISLAREEAALLQGARQAQAGTWRQLDDALARLAMAVQQAGVRGADPASRLQELAGHADAMAGIARLLAAEGTKAGADVLFWTQAVLNSIAAHRADLAQPADPALRARLQALEDTARAMAMAMEFGFLLDPARKLLSIGYSVAEGALDPSCYDLLASEARLASFIAIAKGDVPTKHWFRLGRAVTAVGSGAALISWSGSMFEYLMPSLVMRAPLGSLLEQTSRLVVRRQVAYAASLRLPWGISESAYNARDLEFTYQYSNFGVPGLGLKRGLRDNQVIAPYATALATMVDPRAAAANLARLAGIGARGRYGFYEAMDYTPGRVPAGQTVAVVRAFMAHHQAMSILAIGDSLFDGVMRTRFHAEPIVQATELLLQERTPRDVTAARPWTAEAKPAAAAGDTDLSGGRRFTTAHQPEPATHLLSNGSLTTLLTAAGSGCLRWRNVAVTRWREDATCDGIGQYILLRDVQGGAAWSAGLQPSGAEPDAYNVVFNEDRAEFTRRDGALTTTLEVLVSAEDDAEVRRVTIRNSGPQVREVEVTSYAELALSSQADDVAQPAFFKLFVETEHLDGALLATRRRRTPDEAEIWAAHFAVVEGTAIGGAEVETDRARFLGRGRSIRDPAAMTDGHALSGTVGNVLDPIFAVRHRVRVPPGGMVRVAFWTVVAETRAALLDGVDKHRDTAAFGRAAMLAWTQAQAELYHLGITAAKAGLFQQLAGHAIFASPTLRPPSELIRRGAGPQSGLWGLSVSGDLPIVLLRIDDDEDIDVARDLLQAHGYWRMKGLAVDLVILNERQSSYVQDLQVALETLVRTAQLHPGKDGSAGRVYVLRADLVSAETQALLGAVARVVLVAQRGSLSDQVERRDAAQARPSPRRGAVPWEAQPSPPEPQLEFPNGLGGFAQDGTEYATTLGPGQATPAPWINVIANPRFGFLASAEGAGVTWSANSRENQLTPWSNDPATDRAGEAFYLRDEDAGAVWTPTAQPIRNPAGTYVARHGRGRSGFEHAAYGIAASLVQFVPLDAAVKVSRLVLRNRSGRARRLSATAYVEWVLGPSRTASLAFVQTWIDPETGAMFARNPWSTAFGSPVAFIDLRGAQVEWTGDRREFIGRNGTLADPAALAGTLALSGVTGAGLDPCGALRAKVQLAPGATAEVVCLLGEAASVEEARSLVRQYRAADLDAVLAEVAGFWDGVLGAVQVTTPDRAMDIMLNGWLLYQTLACRVWARAAFYQASGAYGFRDQLQDGMALASVAPGLTREHLLRAAARQFPQGDVQHWWLPHSGQGVRTRIADDRAWLAYTVAQYVGVTGDAAVLDEALPFLEGQDLTPGQHDAFFLPTVSGQAASLFEHCALALDDSLQVGRHGLPLMGTGDWNDGMNRVGEGGQGESIWLGWFLHAALEAFAPVAEARGDLARAAAWRAHAAGLQASLEQEAWDGAWYLRAFFDDGTPLGSATSEECRIDSIAQSWAVLSGAAAPERADLAMAALERDLIRPADHLALLFTPPFDRTPLDPGYIKGYPPGVRENGGQYTHAAMWSVLAFAKRGEGGKAAGLFALLNPIGHSSSPADMQRYKVEPYVVAADVYAAPPHVGRGGWTWYTGSAGWMHRAGLEGILGVQLQAGVLHLDPCIPKDWPGFEVLLRHGSARYRIVVGNPHGVERGVIAASLDGGAVAARPLRVRLVDDGALHQVEVRLGPAVPAVEDHPMPEAAPV